jgi:hypothetical protein
MRRICFLICMVTLTASVAAGRAQAAPLTLSIVGSAFDKPINETIDVSNGFSGTTLPLTDFPIGAVYGSIPEGGSKSIASSISLQVTLSDSTQTLASLTLSGPIQGTLNHPLGDPDLQGLVQGSATPGTLNVFPGVAQSELPSWLPGLGAAVSGNVTGGSENLLQSSLSISPGTASPSGPQSTPEPTSLTIFLACAGVGFGWLCHRRA